MENKLLVLRDKIGRALYDDCIIYGLVPCVTKEKYHWRLYLNADRGEFEMIACEYGYVHCIQPKHLVDMVLVGSFEKHKHLLECD